MPPPPPPPSLQIDPARKLGRYELIAQIASGGMGVVLLARLAGAGGFQRLFAIKLLHAHYARDTEFVEMLLDEARIAAGIHHSNVVGIHEICQSDEHGYYLVMDYVDGFALSDVMEAADTPGPGHWRMTNRILVDALMGLEAAHSLLDAEGRPLSVVHRDVSPQNILVGVDGVSRVTDFGVARAAARISHSQVGQVKGKLPYMAPEQARGENIDARTDLFAMGVVLWECVTGRRLFKRENVQKTADAVLMGEIPSVSAVAKGVPPALEAVCARALERDPAARFQSAREFARALEVGARAHRLLADVHEVGAWLRKAFDEQLTTRRSAIREATGSGAIKLEMAKDLPGGLRIPRLPERPVRVQPATENLRPPGSRTLTQPPAPAVPRPQRKAEPDARSLGDDGPSLTPVRPPEALSAILAAAGVPPRPSLASKPASIAAAPPRPKVSKPGAPVPPAAPAAAPQAPGLSELAADLYEEPTKTPVNDFRMVSALLTAAARDSLPAPAMPSDASEDSDPSSLDTDDEPTELTNWAPPAIAARRAAAAAARATRDKPRDADAPKAPAARGDAKSSTASGAAVGGSATRVVAAPADSDDIEDDTRLVRHTPPTRPESPATQTPPPAAVVSDDEDEDTRLVARDPAPAPGGAKRLSTTQPPATQRAAAAAPSRLSTTQPPNPHAAAPSHGTGAYQRITTQPPTLHAAANAAPYAHPPYSTGAHPAVVAQPAQPPATLAVAPPHVSDATAPATRSGSLVWLVIGGLVVMLALLAVLATLR